MSPETTQPPIATRVRILTILWLAFLVAVGIYAVVLFFIVTTTDVPPVMPVETLRLVLQVIGGALAFLSLWWRRRFTNQVVLDIGARPSNGPNGDPLDELTRRCVLAWAMADAIAILGLVLGILSRNVGDFVPFAAAALLVLYLNRPAAWRIQSIIDRARASG